MKKVKVTQEQAEHIELVKSERNIETVIGNVFFNKRKYRRENSINDVIENIGLEKMLKAIYIGYEVEPEFKIADWVKSTIGKGIGQITKIDSLGYHTDFGMIADCDVVRHATDEEVAEEKQRRWWAKHGRDVWELKEGDVILQKEDVYPDIVLGVDQYDNVHFEDDNMFRLEYIKTKYKIICFAEDRKDVEHE